MHADVKGALEYMQNHPEANMHFTHKGEVMSNEQIRKALEYSLEKGYKTTAELSDEEVDEIVKPTPIDSRHPNSIRFIDTHANSLYSSVLLSERRGKLKEELHEMLWVALKTCYDKGYGRGIRDVAQP